MANKDKYINDSQSLQSELKGLLTQHDPFFEKYASNANLNNIAEDIIQSFKISDNEILTTILQKRMPVEFNMQINNLHHPKRISEIALKTKDSEVKIRVKNNEDVDLSNNISLGTEVIYIDDPYAMDNLHYLNPFMYQGANYFTHREHLRMCLAGRNRNRSIVPSVKEALDEIITSKKLDNIFDKLNSVCSGEVVRKNARSFAYRESGSRAIIDITNVSTGLKTFAIIKTLLLNGCLEENGTIVLDEPEIHLHPEWQLIFAELIVLIQKEFNMHILLNTHSPYFLNAIEVYSHKHGIADRCKYYLSEITNTTATIPDVSDNIEKIYEKLARPLQDLENERYYNG